MKMIKCTTLLLLISLSQDVRAGGLASELVEAAVKIGFQKTSEHAAKQAAKAASRKAVQTASREAVESSSKSIAKKVMVGSSEDALRAGSKVISSTGLAASKFEKPLAAAMTNLDAQQSRRLSMLLPELDASGKAPQILSLIAKNGAGDKLVDFLWRNKATIAGGAAIATLLANPDAAIAASGDVAQTAIITAGETVVKPIATQNSTGVLFGIVAMAAIAFVSMSTSRFRTWLSLTWYLFKPMRKHK